MARFLRRSSSYFQIYSPRIKLITSIPLMKSIDSRVLLSSSLFQNLSRVISTTTTTTSDSAPPSTLVSTTTCDFTPRYKVSCILDEYPMPTGNGNNRRPDANRWIVQMSPSGLSAVTEQELFNIYIKTLASVVGSDDEAKRLIYLVSCGNVYGFGAEIDARSRAQLLNVNGVLAAWEDTDYDARNVNSKGTKNLHKDSGAWEDDDDDLAFEDLQEIVIYNKLGENWIPETFQRFGSCWISKNNGRCIEMDSDFSDLSDDEMDESISEKNLKRRGFLSVEWNEIDRRDKTAP